MISIVMSGFEAFGLVTTSCEWLDLLHPSISPTDAHCANMQSYPRARVPCPYIRAV
jgi:hypothetical protein